MTQKTIAQQLVEMQNNLIALDKIINAPKQEVEKKVSSFLITYADGTEQLFVPEERKSVSTTAEILAQLRDRHSEPTFETALDPLPAKVHLRPGFACLIDGTKYNSIMHASRVLNICRHTIKSNLDKNLKGWSYL